MRAATTDNSGDEWVDVQAVDDVVFVHVRLGLIRAVQEDVDEGVDVEAVNHAVQIDVAEQDTPVT